MSLKRRSTLTFDNDSGVALKSTIIDDFTSGTISVQDRESMISSLQAAFVLVLSLIAWLPSFLLQAKLSETRHSLVLLQAANHLDRNDLSSSLDKRRSLREQVKTLEENNANLLENLREHGNLVDPNNNLYRNAEEIEELYLGRIEDLESTIQDWSRKRMSALLSSGPGGHLQVQFTMINDSDETIQQFKIDTFSVDDLPHSLAVFHETVERDLLSNATMEYEVGSSCLNMISGQRATTDADPAALLRVLFAEKGPTPPAHETINGE